MTETEKIIKELERKQKEQYEEIEQQIKKEKLHKKIKDF